MDYLIKYANKGALTLMLGKNGNMYYVDSWDKVNSCTPYPRQSYERFDEAEPVFEKLRKEYGFGEALNTEPEFCNID